MDDTFQPMTFTAVKQLAAPHSWGAAILPVLVAGAFVVGTAGAVAMQPRSMVILGLMLVVCILMQSAVNTFNDYKDFIAGTDTAQTVLDQTDASIVYNRINPRAALYLAIAMLAAAALLGTVVVLLSDLIVLGVGIFAALVLLSYSMGPKLSYHPLGELASGITMGVLITVATYHALTLGYDWRILLCAFVPFIMIALIMQVNNTCDIERDIAAGRRTLPIIIGRKTSGRMIAVFTVVVLVWQIVVSLLFWPLGAISAALALLLLHRNIAELARGPYSLVNRRRIFGVIVKSVWVTNLAWVAGIASAAIYAQGII